MGDSDVGILIGLIGILIAIILFMIGFVILPLYRVKDLTTTIGKNVKDLARNSENFPFFTEAYWASITKESEFWAKLPIQRVDKLLISKEIAENHIESDDKIIVDSGTTIDQIPHILNIKYFNQRNTIEIYTNNLLAAVSAIPPAIKIFLLSGFIDSIYGATYIEEKEEAIRNLNATPATIIVLAASAISFEDGPMVSDQDYHNRIFKETLIKKALDRHLRLIIALDWTKFKEKTNRLQNVLQPADWINALARPNFSLIITNPPDNDTTEPVKMAKKIIEQFNQNSENNKRMKVVICERQ
jgi:DeoR/GlpR family transcriptional regulator of sugar metabolism